MILEGTTPHRRIRCLHTYNLYVPLNQQTLIYSIRLRSAQQRPLYDNELLHFQDRWKMCCTPLLRSSLPLSTPLPLDRPPTYPQRPGRNPSMAWYEVLGIKQEGCGAEGGSGKIASPSSSILQPHLVKANTGQYIPSCHWKRGSDAVAWHANIVTRTNDDASPASLFMASSKEGETLGEVSGKRLTFKSPMVNK